MEVMAAAKAAVKLGSAVMAAVAALTLSSKFWLLGPCRMDGAAKLEAGEGFEANETGRVACWKRLWLEKRS